MADETFLILGGAGLVGLQVARRICNDLRPKRLIGGSPADRAAVRDMVFATENFNSVLGTFSIDDNGDTTLILMSGSQVQNGEFVFLTLLNGN